MCFDISVSIIFLLLLFCNILTWKKFEKRGKELDATKSRMDVRQSPHWTEVVVYQYADADGGQAFCQTIFHFKNYFFWNGMRWDSRWHVTNVMYELDTRQQDSKHFFFLKHLQTTN